jgi:hypothetical protein
MLEVFEGRLGGGKSYSAVLRMVDTFRSGGTVVTNVDIYYHPEVTPVPDPNPEGKAYISDFIAKYFGVVVRPEQLIKVQGEDLLRLDQIVPSGTWAMQTLVVADEAHIQLGVRDHARKEITALFNHFTQARKYFINYVFITQNALNIDARIVRLVQYIWRFRDIEKWIIPGIGHASSLIRVLTLGILNGKYILQSCFDYDGKTLAQKKWMPKNPEIFNLYDTNAILYDTGRSAAVAEPLKLAKTAKKGRNAMIKWVALAAVVMVLVGAYYIVHWFSHDAQTLAGGAPKSGMQATPATPGAGKNTPAPATTPTYQVRKDKMKAAARGFLRTDQGEYTQGEMSADGFVVAVRDRTAKVTKPDGVTLYIVGEDWQVPVVASTPATSSTPGGWSKSITIPAPTQTPLDMGASWKK